MTKPGIPELVAALRGLRDEWNCDQVSAAYVTPEGLLVKLSVSGSLVTIEDDNGHVHAIHSVPTSSEPGA